MLVEPSDLVRTVARLCQLEEPLIALGGGDGSHSAAADVLAGSNTLLLPLPLGTRNHFARRHGLASVQDAIQALRDGTVVNAPIAEVNGRVFVNNASCGLYAHQVRLREQLQPLMSRWPAAMVAGFAVALRRPLLELELDTGGAPEQLCTAVLWVGIGAESLRLPVPGGTTKGDVLELLWPRVLGRRALLALGLRLGRQLWRGGNVGDRALQTRRTFSAVVRSAQPVPMAVDGEVQEWTGPLCFRYCGRVLRILRLPAHSRRGPQGQI
jgi:diacylglycerol kinase family enzyme